MISTNVTLLRPSVVAVIGLSLLLQTRAGGEISGRVVDASTGQPLGGVEINLSRIPVESTQFPLENDGRLIVTSSLQIDTVRTGADGRFIFKSLQSGAYEPGGWRAGWSWIAHDTRADGFRPWITLATDEQRTGITLSAKRLATLSGRVLDERGQPVIGAGVLALSQTSVAGLLRFRSVQSVSDDRGVFSMTLQPGWYVVGIPEYWSRRSDALRVASANGRALASRGAFFPAADTPATATALALSAGEAREGVEIRLTTGPVFEVRGEVLAARGLTDLDLELIRDDQIALLYGASSFASARPDGAGRFTIQAVPPGQYRLRARRLPQMPMATHGLPPLTSLPSEPTLWLEERLTVVDRDVDVRATLREGARVSGRVEFDGGSPPTLEALKQRTLTVSPANGDYTELRGTYLPDGRFTTIQLPAGRYQILPMAPDGWHLKSVVANGRDVADYPLDVGSTDISGVVITFTDRPALLRGHVLHSGGNEHGRAWVTIFPTDRTLWSEYGRYPRTIAMIETGSAETYEAKLPAGSYYAVATYAGLGIVRTPQRFAELAAVATALTLGDGETKTQDLKVQDR